MPVHAGVVANSTRRANRAFSCQAPQLKNISLYQNYDLRYQSRRPVPTEGRFAIVTIRRARMRWTLWRQVWQRDPGKVGNRFSDKDHAQTRHTGRKRCGGRRSRVVLAPRPWRYVGGNSPPATGARKAASPGRARISRKTIARGKPGCPGCTCSLKPVCFLSYFRTWVCGRSRRPAFPAPSRREGHKFALLRRNSRREKESACLDVKAGQFSRRRRRPRSRPAIRAVQAQIRQPACSPVARP
jgi:hypothetical protein